MISLNDFASTKKQGDAGLAVAISSFVLSGYTVCLPLTDSQEYDLVVGKDNYLYKVQVKTATVKKSDYYKVELRTRTTKDGKNYFKLFDKSVVDYLFVLSLNNDRYIIPTKEIKVVNSLTLTSDFDIFKIGT